VQPDVIYSDPKVVDFTQGTGLQQSLPELLSFHQSHYLSQLIQDTFEFDSLTSSLTQFDKEQESSLEFEDESLRKDLSVIYEKLISEGENTRKFRAQLMILLQQEEQDKLLQRVEKGTTYYLNFLTGVLETMILHEVKVEDFSRIKSYQNGLEDLELEMIRKYLGIAKSSRLIQAILQGEITGRMPDIEQQVASLRKSILDSVRKSIPEKAKSSTKTGRKKTKEKSSKAPKEKKEDSKSISVNLFLAGKSPQEIADEREFALSTIMGHLAHGVKSGVLTLDQLVAEEDIREIQSAAGMYDSLKPYFEHFNGKYDYETLRLVLFSGKEEE
jgi:hypothetical protein